MGIKGISKSIEAIDPKDRKAVFSICRRIVNAFEYKSPEAIQAAHALAERVNEPISAIFDIIDKLQISALNEAAGAQIREDIREGKAPDGMLKRTTKGRFKSKRAEQRDMRATARADALKGIEHLQHYISQLSPESTPDQIGAAVSQIAALPKGIERGKATDALSIKTKIAKGYLNDEIAGLAMESGRFADDDKRQSDYAREYAEELEGRYKSRGVLEVFEWQGSHWQEIPAPIFAAYMYELREGEPESFATRDVDAIASGVCMHPVIFDARLVSPKTTGCDEVNFKNCTLTYKPESGEWVQRAHDKDDLFLHAIPHDYDPTAEAPRFERFLEEVMPSDDEAQQALLEMIGYSLVPHTRYESYAILQGTGANGKSVLLNLIRDIVGDAAASVSQKDFENNFYLSELEGKLVNLMEEIEAGEALDDATLKRIVSGNTITVAKKFKDPRSFSPYSTEWLATNHLPRSRDTTEAVYRRTIIFNFTQSFKGARADVHLREKLKDEASGIIRMALEAYRDAIARGCILDPQSSQGSKAQWRRNNNQLIQWLEDACEVRPYDIDAPHELKASDAYEHYKTWASSSGITKPLALNSFGARLSAALREKGDPEPMRRMRGGSHYRGVTLIEQKSIYERQSWRKY